MLLWLLWIVGTGGVTWTAPPRAVCGCLLWVGSIFEKWQKISRNPTLIPPWNKAEAFPNPIILGKSRAGITNSQVAYVECGEGTQFSSLSSFIWALNICLPHPRWKPYMSGSWLFWAPYHAITSHCCPLQTQLNHCGVCRINSPF